MSSSRCKKKRIIFLDVDGVLNSKYTSNLVPDSDVTGLDDVLLDRLKRLVDETHGCIVLISSWKLDLHKNRFGDYLEDRLREYDLQIMDVTNDSGIDRAYGIRNYLIDHGEEIQSFIIIDDRISYYYNDDDNSLCERLILTDCNEGLSQEDVKKAIDLLR